MAGNSGQTSINGGQDREEGEELSNKAFLTQFMKIQQENVRIQQENQQENARIQQENQQENTRIQQQNSTTLKLLTERHLILERKTEHLSENLIEYEARLKAVERQVGVQSQGNNPQDNWTPLTPAHDEQDDESEDYDRFVPNRRRYFKSNMTRIPGPTGPTSDRYICPRCKKDYANSYILLHVNRGTCVERRVAP